MFYKKELGDIWSILTLFVENGDNGRRGGYEDYLDLDQNHNNLYFLQILWHISTLKVLFVTRIRPGDVLKYNNALCGYPIVKMKIGDSSQISTTAPIFLLFNYFRQKYLENASYAVSLFSTTAPIFLLSNYFRQKYLEIASCAVSLLNNIWVRVEHSLLHQLNLQKSQLQFKQSAGRIWIKLWGRVEH